MFKKTAIIAAIVLLVTLAITVAVQYTKIQKLSVDSHTLSKLIDTIGTELGTNIDDWQSRLRTIQDGYSQFKEDNSRLQGLLEAAITREASYRSSVSDRDRRIQQAIAERDAALGRINDILNTSFANDEATNATFDRLENFGRRIAKQIRIGEE